MKITKEDMLTSSEESSSDGSSDEDFIPATPELHKKTPKIAKTTANKPAAGVSPMEELCAPAEEQQKGLTPSPTSKKRSLFPSANDGPARYLEEDINNEVKGPKTFFKMNYVGDQFFYPTERFTAKFTEGLDDESFISCSKYLESCKKKILNDLERVFGNKGNKDRVAIQKSSSGKITYKIFCPNDGCVARTTRLGRHLQQSHKWSQKRANFLVSFCV